MSNSKLLELRGLCVSYGPVEAVHQVDLDVRAGEIVTVKIERADAYDLHGTAVG